MNKKRGEYSTNSQRANDLNESEGMCIGVGAGWVADDKPISSEKDAWAMKAYDNFYTKEELEQPEEQGHDSSCCEKCTACCCQSYTCTDYKSFKTKARPSLSKRLKKAKSFAVDEVCQTTVNAFKMTPLGAFTLDTIKYGTTLFLLILLVPSCIGFYKDPSMLNVLGLVFAGLAFSYEILDLIYYIRNNRCSAYYNSFKWIAKFKENSKEFWKNRKNPAPTNTENQREQADPDNCCQDCCKCCPVKCTYVIDFIRLLMNSLWFFPILLINMFKLIDEYVDKQFPVKDDMGNDIDQKVEILTWIKNGASFGYTAFSIYITRIIVLFVASYSINKVQNIKLTEGVFQFIFSLYSSAQMAIQILMIIAIGIRYQQEYHKCKSTESEYSSCEFNISINLWYMIYLAYILPIISTIMFFIVHHYWTQMFFLTFYYNILQILKKPNIVNALKGREQKAQNIHVVMNCEKFERDYAKFSKIDIGQKFVYPFTNPAHVFFCFLYAGHLLGFLGCFLINLPNLNLTWYIFAAVGLGLGIVINWYVFTVTAVYLIIIVSILVMLPFFIILCICFSSAENQNQTRR